MSLKINEIYNMNCIEGMKLINSESVDLIAADPPYGIRYGENEGLYNRSKEGILSGYVDIPLSLYPQFSKEWIQECYRVLKETGSIYIVSGWQNYPILFNCVQDARFTILNMLAWQYQFGTNTKKKFVTAFNPIIFAVKNTKKYKFYKNCRFSDTDRTTNGNKAHYKDRESVFYITKERWEDKLTTPTKLPYDLIEKIIQYSSVEGDVVLDPFMASGQTAWVARDLGRDFLGFEVSKEFCEFAKARLETNQYTIPIKKSAQITN